MILEQFNVEFVQKVILETDFLLSTVVVTFLHGYIAFETDRL